MWYRVSSFTMAGLVLATIAVMGQGATPPEVTFKVEVNYVEVDARVMDGDGKFVRGLAREDFLVSEDGRPQKITAFGMVDMPFVPVETPAYAGRPGLPIDPDVASNAKGLDGRLYLIVLDDYHIDALRTSSASALARRFILERLDVNDQAAVVTTSGRRDASQEFTSNRRLLLEAVDRMLGQKLAPATVSAINTTTQQVLAPGDAGTDPTMVTRDPEEIQRNFNATSAMQSLRSIVEWIAPIQGRRKAIIFISEGLDYSEKDTSAAMQLPSLDFRGTSLMLDQVSDALSAATRGNVSIYALDPRGTMTIGADAVELAGQPRPETGIGARSLINESFSSQFMLRHLAETTGGFAAVNVNDFKGAFDRIVDENSSYYVLGYYPSNDRRDGRTRSIELKIAGRPELRLTYRKSYSAPRQSERPARAAAGAAATTAAGSMRELTKTMANPLPATSLAMRLAAMPFKGTGGTALVPVLVQLDGAGLKFKEGGGTFNEDLRMLVAAFDKTGKIVAGTGKTVTLRLRYRPETYNNFVKNGMRILLPVSLPPGQYSLRVTAEGATESKQGSVYFDLEVPDWSRSRIALSGVALAAIGDSSITAGNDVFNGGLPVFPTTLREFAAGDQLFAYLEVYDNQPLPIHRLDVTATVRTLDGRTVFTETQTRSSEELKGAGGRFGYTAAIPTNDWVPGGYVLTIQAASRLGNDAPVSRELQFRIR
jgi:VWFA-related protein